MKDLVAPLLRGFALAASALLAASCIDTSPIDYHPRQRTDAGVADAAPNGSDAGTEQQCRACVSGRGCVDLYDKCHALSGCTAFTECVFASHCWNLGTDPGNLPPCIVQCATSSHLLSSEDPAAIAFATLISCVYDKCAAECGVTSR